MASLIACVVGGSTNMTRYLVCKIKETIRDPASTEGEGDASPRDLKDHHHKVMRFYHSVSVADPAVELNEENNQESSRRLSDQRNNMLNLASCLHQSDSNFPIQQLMKDRQDAKDSHLNNGPADDSDSEDPKKTESHLAFAVDSLTNVRLPHSRESQDRFSDVLSWVIDRHNNGKLNNQTENKLIKAVSDIMFTVSENRESPELPCKPRNSVNSFYQFYEGLKRCDSDISRDAPNTPRNSVNSIFESTCTAETSKSSDSKFTCEPSTSSSNAPQLIQAAICNVEQELDLNGQMATSYSSEELTGMPKFVAETALGLAAESLMTLTAIVIEDERQGKTSNLQKETVPCTTAFIMRILSNVLDQVRNEDDLSKRVVTSETSWFDTGPSTFDHINELLVNAIDSVQNSMAADPDKLIDDIEKIAPSPYHKATLQCIIKDLQGTNSALEKSHLIDNLIRKMDIDSDKYADHVQELRRSPSVPSTFIKKTLNKILSDLEKEIAPGTLKDTSTSSIFAQEIVRATLKKCANAVRDEIIPKEKLSELTAAILNSQLAIEELDSHGMISEMSLKLKKKLHQKPIQKVQEPLNVELLAENLIKTTLKKARDSLTKGELSADHLVMKLNTVSQNNGYIPSVDIHGQVVPVSSCTPQQSHAYISAAIDTAIRDISATGHEGRAATITFSNEDLARDKSNRSSSKKRHGNRSNTSVNVASQTDILYNRYAKEYYREGYATTKSNMPETLCLSDITRTPSRTSVLDNYGETTIPSLNSAIFLVKPTVSSHSPRHSPSMNDMALLYSPQTMASKPEQQPDYEYRLQKTSSNKSIGTSLHSIASQTAFPCIDDVLAISYCADSKASSKISLYQAGSSTQSISSLKGSTMGKARPTGKQTHVQLSTDGLKRPLGKGKTYGPSKLPIISRKSPSPSELSLSGKRFTRSGPQKTSICTTDSERRIPETKQGSFVHFPKATSKKTVSTSSIITSRVNKFGPGQRTSASPYGRTKVDTARSSLGTKKSTKKPPPRSRKIPHKRSDSADRNKCLLEKLDEKLLAGGTQVGNPNPGSVFLLV